MIIAAHPDDEVLGVGATAARHANNGDKVHVLIVSEGETSRARAKSKNVAVLRNAAIASAKVLGAEKPIFLGLPDNRLDSIDFLNIVQKIEERVLLIQPEIVYTHHGGDLNLDHQIVHRAVMTAFRPIPGSSVRKLFSFETLSSTEWSSLSIGPSFNPTHFVNITQTLDVKLAALNCYEMELRDYPHPRSIDAIKSLAKVRGSHVGVPAAEAFEVILDITY